MWLTIKLSTKSCHIEQILETGVLLICVYVVTSSDHAVTKTVCCTTKLQRHVQIASVLWPVISSSVIHQICDGFQISDSPLEKIVNDYPLIVFSENFLRGFELVSLIHNRSVGSQKGNVHLRNDQILIV